MSEVTKAKRGHPSPMMFVSIGIGAVLAIALISVVSALTGGKVTSGSTQIPSALQGKTIAHFSESGLYGGTEKAPWEDHHPSVLVFFASWCTVCQPEIPKVATYVSTHNLGGVVVLGIDANDTRSAAQAFVKKDRVKFPVAFWNIAGDGVSQRKRCGAERALWANSNRTICCRHTALTRLVEAKGPRGKEGSEYCPDAK